MTGMTDRIIHSGRVPERRKASMSRRRLIAFLRRWPELVRTSTWSVRASSSRSIRLMMSRTASAPMPALNRRPRPVWLKRSSSWRYSVSPMVIIGLMPSSSSRTRRSSSFVPWACSASFSRSPRRVSSMRGPQVVDLLVDRGRLVALARLDLLVDPLGLGADDLAEVGDGLLAALLAGGDDDLAGRARRRSSRPRRPVLSAFELGLDGLGGDDDLLGPGGALGLQLRLRRGQLDGQLVLVLGEVRPQLVLELGQAPGRTCRRGRSPPPRAGPAAGGGRPRRRS